MTDAAFAIAGLVTRAERRYRDAEAEENTPFGGTAVEKFRARGAVLERMVQYDAARQGLIAAWEQVSQQTWPGQRVLYDKELDLAY